MRVAVIPARGGSVRVPRKNVKLFHDKPMIAYSIEGAQQSGMFDRIIVSSDDKEILSVAERYGAELFLRGQGMCEESIGTQQVAAEVLEWINATSALPDWCCCIYATAPMMTPEEIKWAYEWIKLDSWRYVYVPGWYYWGRPKSFIEEPDDFRRSLKVYVSAARWVDINTHEDWARAEKMYAEWRKNETCQRV